MSCPTPSHDRPRRQGFILAATLATVAVVSLLTSLLLLSLRAEAARLERDCALAQRRWDIEQAAEQFLMGLEPDALPEGMIASVEGDRLLITDEEGRLLLLVQRDGEGRILRWQTGEGSGE